MTDDDARNITTPDERGANVARLPVQVDLCPRCKRPARLFVWGLCTRCRADEATSDA